MTHLRRHSLRYEISAFRAMVRDLVEDPHLSDYYEGSSVRSQGARPLPGLLEDVATTLVGLVPAMSERLRMDLHGVIGSLPAFEPPGVLFALWERLLVPTSPRFRATLHPQRRSWRVL